MTTDRFAVRGVTLIEMVIVVAILMLVAALVYPNYADRALRAKRVDAKSALLSAAAEQEKFFLRNNEFATTLDQLGITETDNDYYLLTLNRDTPTTYEITATAQGAQANDTKCETFTINQIGQRTATGDSVDSNKKCWQ